MFPDLGSLFFKVLCDDYSATLDLFNFDIVNLGDHFGQVFFIANLNQQICQRDLRHEMLNQHVVFVCNGALEIKNVEAERHIWRCEDSINAVVKETGCVLLLLHYFELYAKDVVYQGTFPSGRIANADQCWSCLLKFRVN